MPIEIKYLDGGVGFEMTGKGTVSGEEISNVLNEIYSNELVPKQKYQLWYFIDVEGYEFSDNDFTRMVNQDVKASKINPNIIVGVVGGDDFMYGISRMWEAHMELEESGFETKVFKKKEDAKVWISKKIK